MHHHNKKQGLSKREKVLFTDKENELLIRVRYVMRYGEKIFSQPIKKWIHFNKVTGKKLVQELL